MKKGRDMTDMYHVLGIEELRTRILAHTRKAYALLQLPERARILDIGCGRGLQTVELARLSEGDIVGIDIDNSALSQLRQRVEREDLSTRITVVSRSLYESGFADESFDLLWEEGVLHLLDASKSFRECHRVLKTGGLLVMHETISWFEGVKNILPGFGFRHVVDHLLPKHYWWTEYGAPLEERIRLYREAAGGAVESGDLAPYEQEVIMIKADPMACGFFVIQKTS